MRILTLAVALCSSLSAQVSVTTFAYDNQRDGANLNETILTQSTVTGLYLKGNFPVDGCPVQAQPLIVSGVNIQGATSLLLVNTLWANGVPSAPVTNSCGGKLYAFDALRPGRPPLWVDTLVTIAGSYGGCKGTPVIDTSAGASGVIYMACTSGPQASSVHQIFAKNLADGSNFFSPVTIAGTSGGVTYNSPGRNSERCGLTLLGGVLYFGSSGGEGVQTTPYASSDGTGAWWFAYNSTTGSQIGAIMLDPLHGAGGVWHGNGAAAVDSSGNIRVSTGNGWWDGTANWGQTLLAFSPGGVSISSWFTPSNWAVLNNNDADESSAWPICFGTHCIYIGKDGNIWLDATGGLQGSGGTFTQEISTGVSLNATSGGGPAWVYAPDITTLFVSGFPEPIQSYQFNGTTFPSSPTATSTATFNLPNARMSYSSAGSGSGILWATTNANAAANVFAVGKLIAFNPANFAILWQGQLTNGTYMGGMVTLSAPPVVANGNVYVTSSDRGVSMFGLGVPTGSVPSGTSGGVVN